MADDAPRTLYLVISGARVFEEVDDLARMLVRRGWRTTVICTPAGAAFYDFAVLERITATPVRLEYRRPGTGTSLPPPDAVLACPLTFNSVNKFAHGHSDNFAIGVLCEMAGYGVPTVVVPHCKPELAAHPAFGASLRTLRSMGVRVLYDDGPEPPPPWTAVADALEAVSGR